MAINVSTKTNMTKEVVPAGTHIARCYAMIHVGTQEFEWQGEVKSADKVRVSFELPNEMRTFGNEEKPMVIDKEYSLSLHEQSNLRKDLETWRGKAFTNDELAMFDITKLLSKTCLLSIIHAETKAGKTYPKITAISKMTKGTTCEDQINPTFQFNYEDSFDTQWLSDTCPSWLAETIKNTPEYDNRISQLEGAEFDKQTQKGDDLPF
jgi:hypothetical protein